MIEQQHGGNLDAAVGRYGGPRSDWLDLSTGINPVPWPVPILSPEAWSRLPESGALSRLHDAARGYYGLGKQNSIVAAAGVQALIQLLPLISPHGSVRIVNPTYNEYAATFCNHDNFQIESVDDIAQLANAQVAVVVNPNNPDGRRWQPVDLLSMAGKVELLIVDEAFADTDPAWSLCSCSLPENVVVLRSFGKFFGLAGVRLGFAVANPALCGRIGSLLGPWAISGPAIEVGTSALLDVDWIATTRIVLFNNMNRLKDNINVKDMEIVGGTDLFLTVSDRDAYAIHDRLASAHIWTRVFDHEPSWIRFGLPGSELQWDRFAQTLKTV